MRKLLLFLFVVALTAVIYTIATDPRKKEEILGTIEKSTGVDLDAAPDKIAKDAGKAVGNAADAFLKDLGNTLTDPQFYRSLERWGKDALNKLDESELRKLKKDIKKEAGKAQANYEAVLEKYLGEGA